MLLGLLFLLPQQLLQIFYSRIYILNMNQKTAQGSTLFMFLFPVGILGVYNYQKAGLIDYKTAAIMAITFIIGSYLGGRTVVAVDTKIIKQIFGSPKNFKAF